MSSLRSESLTWAGLLTQWVRFAQASLALPDDADGPRWRASVAGVINLQAVTFALADLDRLATDERALALDKAEILIRDNTDALRAVWGDELPDSLREVSRDARLALDSARVVRDRNG